MGGCWLRNSMWKCRWPLVMHAVSPPASSACVVQSRYMSRAFKWGRAAPEVASAATAGLDQEADGGGRMWGGVHGPLEPALCMYDRDRLEASSDPVSAVMRKSASGFSQFWVYEVFLSWFQSCYPFCSVWLIMRGQQLPSWALCGLASSISLPGQPPFPSLCLSVCPPLVLPVAG